MHVWRCKCIQGSQTISKKAFPQETSSDKFLKPSSERCMFDVANAYSVLKLSQKRHFLKKPQVTSFSSHLQKYACLTLEMHTGFWNYLQKGISSRNLKWQVSQAISGKHIFDTSFLKPVSRQSGPWQEGRVGEGRGSVHASDGNYCSRQDQSWGCGPGRLWGKQACRP
jgi:hypothetical protein